jgi:hypothetical protein
MAYTEVVGLSPTARIFESYHRNPHPVTANRSRIEAATQLNIQTILGTPVSIGNAGGCGLLFPEVS